MGGLEGNNNDGHDGEGIFLGPEEEGEEIDEADIEPVDEWEEVLLDFSGTLDAKKREEDLDRMVQDEVIEEAEITTGDRLAVAIRRIKKLYNHRIAWVLTGLTVAAASTGILIESSDSVRRGISTRVNSQIERVLAGSEKDSPLLLRIAGESKLHAAKDLGNPKEKYQLISQARDNFLQAAELSEDKAVLMGKVFLAEQALLKVIPAYKAILRVEGDNMELIAVLKQELQLLQGPNDHILQELKDLSLEIGDYLAAGMAANQLGEESEAIEYLGKAISDADIKNEEIKEAANTLINLLKKQDQYLQAAEIQFKLGDREGVETSLNLGVVRTDQREDYLGFARTYEDLGKYSMAAKYFLIAGDVEGFKKLRPHLPSDTEADQEIEIKLQVDQKLIERFKTLSFKAQNIEDEDAYEAGVEAWKIYQQNAPAMSAYQQRAYYLADHMLRMWRKQNYFESAGIEELKEAYQYADLLANETNRSFISGNDRYVKIIARNLVPKLEEEGKLKEAYEYAVDPQVKGRLFTVALEEFFKNPNDDPDSIFFLTEGVGRFKEIIPSELRQKIGEFADNLRLNREMDTACQIYNALGVNLELCSAWEEFKQRALN